MFANLVENAIRHGPMGTAISCRVDIGDGRAVVTVADDGLGIPEGEHERVRRHFYRLEKGRTTPGSGLGRALVKAVADLQGAVLRLEDARPGPGLLIAFPTPPRAERSRCGAPLRALRRDADW